MHECYVLIGAGSAMFTRGLLADLIRSDKPSTLALVDTDPDALQVAERLAAKMIAARHAPITLRAHTDRRAVLSGATAVICTIGVGGRRAWEQDVFIPRRYGIFQPVGDSVMPGGTSRALRMIPAMVDIARDVLDLAPEALFFNYGNPMAPVCRAVRKATGAPVVGLCHGVFHVGHFLAGVLGVDPARLRYTAVGMNHLTWFTEVRADGADLMPRLRAMGAQQVGRSKPGDAGPLSWHLLHLFGAFPAVLDRHVTEFFPALFNNGQYYGKTLGVDAYSFEDTIAHGDRIYDEMRETASADGPLPDDYFDAISGEHEQVVDIIDHIRADAGRIYSANVPNQGQLADFPPAAIVECPCVADAAGLRPIAQPPLPSGLVGTLATRFQWVETVVDAALTGRRDLVVQALVLDGAVDSLDTAERLTDDLLTAHAAFLPQFADLLGSP